jgi:hypothetical protein
MGAMRSAYNILVGKPEEIMRNLGVDRILEELGWELVDRLRLALGRDQWRALVNTVMSLWVP